MGLKPGREAALKRAGSPSKALTHRLKPGARKSLLKQAKSFIPGSRVKVRPPEIYVPENPGNASGLLASRGWPNWARARNDYRIETASEAKRSGQTVTVRYHDHTEHNPRQAKAL